MQDDRLRSLGGIRTATATDLVFDELYNRVISLDLPPGTRLSEVEVARRMGVSRQPVRDAFYRLSQLGFIRIRPQRATTVTPISEAAVHQARFVRTALELETASAAVSRLTDADIGELAAMLAEQERAVLADERLRFHELDDDFHRTICRMSGHEYAWTLIRDTKAHMDRVRYLSLAFGAQSALDDHKQIFAAFRDRDTTRAREWMRRHLNRIEAIIAQIRAENDAFFEDSDRVREGTRGAG